MDTKNSPPTPEMTYANSFKFNFDFVNKLSKEQSKGLSEFINIISQRINCELQYSKELGRISTLKCRLSLG